MEQASAFIQNNSSMLTTIAFLVVIIMILYVVYTYLYPADDPTYTRFLAGEADARHPVKLTKGSVPIISTGGDFTLSFWLYIDDWNYKVSSTKFVLAISPQHVTKSSVSPLVLVLTPLQNSLIVAPATISPGPGPGPTEQQGPDITVESNLQSVMNQQSSMQMFQTTVDNSTTDIKDIPLQRWVNVTIVSSGRVLDIYMDGKLSRSRVLENVVKVPAGPLELRLGDYNGFGGHYSSVQMWSAQLTPDVIYGIYQMGPTQTQHNIFTDITKYLNLNVSFTGPAGGQGQGQGQPGPPVSNPFSQISADNSSSVAGQGQAMMARF